MTIAIALLMVSTIAYPAFKQPGILRPKSVTAILTLLGIGFLVLFYPLMILFVVFSIYVLIGPVSWIARSVGKLFGWSPKIPEIDIGE